MWKREQTIPLHREISSWVDWWMNHPLKLSLDQRLEEGHWLEEGELERIVTFSLAKGKRFTLEDGRCLKGQTILGLFSLTVVLELRCMWRENHRKEVANNTRTKWWNYEDKREVGENMKWDEKRKKKWLDNHNKVLEALEFGLSWKFRHDLSRSLGSLQTL